MASLETYGFDLSRTIRIGRSTDARLVYGYRFSSHPDRIKIGKTTRGLKRVLEQSTSFPEPPRIVFLIHHPDPGAVEEAMHEALAERRAKTVGREWFMATEREVVRLVRKTARRFGLLPALWGFWGAAGRLAAAAAGIWLVSAAAAPAAWMLMNGSVDMGAIGEAYLEGAPLWWADPRALMDAAQMEARAIAARLAGPLLLGLWSLSALSRPKRGKRKRR